MDLDFFLKTHIAVKIYTKGSLSKNQTAFFNFVIKIQVFS